MIAVGSAVLLAVVFALSGAAKLVRPERTVGLLDALRVPAFSARTSVVRVFALLELLLATALIGARAEWFAVAAAAALAVSTVFVGIALAATRLPDPADCGCFGDLVEAKTGAGMVIRNVLLWCAALVLGWTTISGAAGVLWHLIDAQGDARFELLAAFVGILGAAVIVFGPRLGVGGSAKAPSDAPAEATPQDARRYVGRVDAIPEGIVPGTTLLLRAGCAGCERVLDRLETLIAGDPDADIGATVIVDGDPARFTRQRPLVAAHAQFGIGDLQERFGIASLPAAVFLEPDGRFLRRLGSTALLELLPLAERD